jgi:uncharacterized membrane protein
MQLKHDRERLLQIQQQLETAYEDSITAQDGKQARIAALEEQLREALRVKAARDEEAARATAMAAGLIVNRLFFLFFFLFFVVVVVCFVLFVLLTYVPATFACCRAREGA